MGNNAINFTHARVHIYHLTSPIGDRIAKEFDRNEIQSIKCIAHASSAMWRYIHAFSGFHITLPYPFRNFWSETLCSIPHSTRPAIEFVWTATAWYSTPYTAAWSKRFIALDRYSLPAINQQFWPVTVKHVRNKTQPIMLQQLNSVKSWKYYSFSSNT